MNILVVGGTRFMGKHMVRELLSKGHEVTIANRGLTQDEFADRVNRVIIDRMNPGTIKAKLSDQHFDILFDTIAYCSNDVKALLDHVSCEKYVMISTSSVYDEHMDTKEEEFDPYTEPVVWCDRKDYSYQEIKRQAERAIVQTYAHIPSVMVRFPYVIGTDDYTKRFQFYVEHIVNQIPMHVDGYDSQMAFVRSDEAGKFLASFADNDFTGAINGASEGTISVHQMTDYVTSKTGKSILLCASAEEAPYNGEADYSTNVDKARAIGFEFTPLHSWVYDLMDHWIDE
ncbi:MAG: NAD-dependent epimerase/dehydratase family protein [Clostridiales bacterium]|nr:NAD-dependent epimerase/dehydratase family protein [Clostridiales bacterium]